MKRGRFETSTGEFVPLQDWLDLYKRFLTLADDDMQQLPKVHMMFHLLIRSIELGCPADYSTWEDEDYNRWLKQCLRLVSQQNFEVLGYMKCMEYVKRRSQKRLRE